MPWMRRKPNLTLVDVACGEITARHELDAGLSKLSIRHLAVRPDGLVSFDNTGDYIAATSPQGGSALVWDLARASAMFKIMRTRGIAMFTRDRCAWCFRMRSSR
jgi:hypothetical protein